jgi:hypothetical protein
MYLLLSRYECSTIKGKEDVHGNRKSLFREETLLEIANLSPCLHLPAGQ